MLEEGLADEQRADRGARVSVTGGQGFFYLLFTHFKRGLFGGRGLARHGHLQG